MIKSKISIILCTHNPDVRILDLTLESIRNQSGFSCSLELIIVDNCSSFKFLDDLNIQFPFECKLIREPNLGLTHARLAGIKESNGDLICFVDDDNILASDYISKILDVISDHPFLGAFGAGLIEPIFDTIPNEDLVSYLSVLAIRNEKKSVISDDLYDFHYPYGAGLVVTRLVALAYCKDLSDSDLKLSLDRKGEILNSCGDDHFSWIAIRNGLKKGVFPQLMLKHYIPSFRIKKKYLLKLTESFGYSRSLLFYINGKDFPGLDIITEINSEANKKPSIVKELYAFYRSVVRKIVNSNQSLENEFIEARNKGVLRFYNTVYLKYGKQHFD